MKKKMKSSTRRVVITLAAIVVLAVAAFALLPGTSGGEDISSVPSVSSDEAVAVVSKERDTIASVYIKNETGEFTIRAATEKDDTNNVFVVDELSDLATNGANLVNAVKMAYNLEILLDIGPIAELPGKAEYGLDKPEVTMVVKYNDGSDDVKILVGDTAASGGNYVLVNDHVYTVEVGDYVYADKYAFLEASVYSIPVMGDGSDIIDYMKLSGRALEAPISLEYTANQKNGPYNALFMPYIITEPYYSGMNTARIDEFMSVLPNLPAAGCAGYDPDEETLAKMGLDEPYLSCEFSINGDEHKFQIGDKHELDKAYRYLMVDDNPVVMVIAESSISTLLKVNVMNLRDGFVWSPTIKKVSGLTATFDGETYKYEISRTEETPATATEAATYTYTAKLNGEDFSYDDFRSLYMTSITPTVVSQDELKTESKPALTLKYTYYAGGSNTVEYYLVTEGERRFAAYIDGEFVGLAKETYVTDIMAAISAE